MMPRWMINTVCAAVAGLASAASGQTVRVLDRAAYADRLRAMWLGECIANWTGLITEGARPEPPFFTDADWGQAFDGRQPHFVTTLDPWPADDDTDVEYVYQHLMASLSGPGAPHTLLSPTEIAAGWQTHINRYIWVSNASARALIGRGVRPPATSLGAANPSRLEIDAQLTTELFGALCPGMPDEALRLSELPIRTTAAGYAAHAAQFYVLLYSLAASVDPALSGRDRAVWLVQQARRYIPDTSKSADIVDFVLADFLANPDVNDWESTRDKVAQRYQANAAANGFVFRAWYESSVNLACGTMALLYGQGDFRRTVQIGALSGWDSDNGTATMGGLLGLMNGTQWIRDQFPGTPLSDRFWILRTRDGLPDFLPGDPAAEDTFEMMAARLVPLVEATVTSRGGTVDPAAGLWTLPPPMPPAAAPVGMLLYNPLYWEDQRSGNLAVRRAGGVVTPWTSAVGHPGPYRGAWWCNAIALGSPQDFSGREPDDNFEVYYSSEGSGSPAGVEQVIQVTYDRPVQAAVIRFVEGDHFSGADGLPQGGWFDSLTAEVLVGGAWVAAAGVWNEALDSSRPFQILDLNLGSPQLVTGIRVRGLPGGSGAFVTCTSLDALSLVPAPARRRQMNGQPAVLLAKPSP